LAGLTSNVQGQLNSKAPSASPSLSNPTLTGTTTLLGDISANGATLTPTELSYLDGATSNLQAQINTKAPSNNPTLAGNITVTGDILANGATLTPTELSYIDGATSNLQTKINTKLNINFDQGSR
jgi:hypothetical protein